MCSLSICAGCKLRSVAIGSQFGIYCSDCDSEILNAARQMYLKVKYPTTKPHYKWSWKLNKAVRV